MLHIVASNHCMQFQGKLMSQTWENGIKNLVPGQFWHLWPIFGPQKTLYGFFGGFYLYWMLYIVASYYCMQFQGKQMCQTWENGKKPSSRSILAPLAQIWTPKNFIWIFLVGFTSTRCYTLLQAIIVCNFKNN